MNGRLRPLLRGLLGFGLIIVVLSMPVVAQGAVSNNVYVNDTSTIGDSWGITAVGNNTNPGTAPDRPVRTLQRALKIAKPDSTILIGAGIFGETIPVNKDGLRIAGSGETGVIGPAGDTGTIFRGNNASDSGIRLNGVQDATVELIRIQNFGAEGAGGRSDQLNALKRLKIIDNGGPGVRLINSQDDYLANLTLDNNGGDGIVLDSSTSNEVHRANITNHPGIGINLFNGSHNNKLINNFVRDNTGDGFSVENSDTPFLQLNTSWSNSERGYEFDNSDSVTMIQNTTQNNNLQELYLHGLGSVNRIYKTNFLTSTTEDILNRLGTRVKLLRSHWLSSDSLVVRAKIDISNGDGVKYIPYRFDKIDTNPIADTVAPIAPFNIQADTKQPRKVVLTWNEVNTNEDPDDNFDIGNYRIYRSKDPTISTWKSEQIAQLGPSDTTYIDTDINPGDTYFYRMTSVDTPTAGDAQKYENESYFSRIVKAKPLDFGPAIYVNDTSTIGDVFTSDVGNDSNIGTPQHPLRTLPRAMDASEPGDTIFVDRGVFHDTALMDTSSVTMVGASPDSTVFDSQKKDTFLTVRAGNVGLRNFTVRENTGAIRFIGTSGFRVANVTVKDNTGGILIDNSSSGRITNSLFKDNAKYGVRILNGSGNYIASNRFDENDEYQVITSPSASNSIVRNNFYMDPSNPDSGVLNPSGTTDNLNYNWWTTADSTSIQDSTVGPVDYIPHRLGVIDTGVTGDSQAPETPPNPSIDTSVAQEITISWDSPSTDEDGTSLTGFTGLRLYRINEASDTPDWTQHLYKTLAPSDTSFTDTNITKEEQYSYRITAFDNHSLENESYFTRVLSGTWVNRVPIANSATVLTQVDSAVKFRLTGSDSDGDPIRFFIDDNVDGDSLVLPSDGTLDRSNFSEVTPKLEYTPDPGFAGTDTMTFVIRDNMTISDTAVITIHVLKEHNVRADSLFVGASQTPAQSGSGGTIPVRVVYRNTKSGTGVVLSDTEHVEIRNAIERNVTDSFTIIHSDTKIAVAGNDTAVGRWIIDVPPTGNQHRHGNFRVEYEFDEVFVSNIFLGDTKPLGDSLPDPPEKTMNILPDRLIVQASKSDDGLDTFSVGVQSVGLKGGIVNGDRAIDTSPLVDGDSVIRMIQRGGTRTIDTPIANPDYNFQTADTFDVRMDAAYDTLKNQDFPSREPDFTRNLTVIDNNLLLISLWRNAVFSGVYLGDSTTVRERSEVVVRNIRYTGQKERLSVVKLLPSDYSWTLVDDLDDPNDVTGSSGDYTIRFDVAEDTGVEGAAFSVFQVIATGVVDKGDADKAIAYPNPFVPYDGNPETGQYGEGPNEGIYFAADKNRGFPPGSVIEIFNVKGERIARFTLDTGGILQWNPFTGNGEPLASGVYVFRVETPDGDQKVGKFAIVR